MVLPKDHCPVCAASVVLLFTGVVPPEAALGWVLAAVGVGTAVAPSVLATCVVAVDILEVLRDVLGLELVRRDSRVDSVR